MAVERADALDGNAIAMIAGEPEPELLADLDPERVGRARPVEVVKRQLRVQNRRGVNWTIAAYPTAGQAEPMFGEPDVERLWEAISPRCGSTSPIRSPPGTRTRAAPARCEQLDALALDAVRFTGPAPT